MKDKMRVMSEKPLNAETPNEYLRSWITANAVFFDRNQGEIPQEPIALSDWQLAIEGEVERSLRFSFDQIYRMPKAIVANTLECSGIITVLGAAYGGETDVESVEVSVDNGRTWNTAAFIGPHELYAWRQWQYVWEVKQKGNYTLMSRATDTKEHQQPMNAKWNVLGYGNNGVREHAVAVQIT